MNRMRDRDAFRIMALFDPHASEEDKFSGARLLAGAVHSMDILEQIHRQIYSAKVK